MHVLCVLHNAVQQHMSALTDMLAPHNGTHYQMYTYHIDSFRGYSAHLDDQWGNLHTITVDHFNMSFLHTPSSSSHPPRTLESVRSMSEVSYVERNQVSVPNWKHNPKLTLLINMQVAKAIDIPPTDYPPTKPKCASSLQDKSPSINFHKCELEWSASWVGS